jgi:UDP-sulfoquinovose synthase
MKIIVFGGDGFCGWPTSLRLANFGHTVVIVDNLSRRRIDNELSSGSLTKIASINDRIKVANDKCGEILYEFLDIAKQPDVVKELLRKYRPDAVVQFAEQRSAPYSMIGDLERRYTVDNNIAGTHNICSAIVDVDPSIHLVHLGTMGVYGYSKAFGAIPEGYLDIKINSTQNDTEILYPANPGSLYHLTKCLDQLIFQFYNKNWGLKITDLHQGIVWGVETEHTKLAPELVNRFDYDGIYGTVLNRFISQAANGLPLTVYGTGGQSRAFIHI